MRSSEAEHRHLIVGHVCWDELADGRMVLGGTAYYAALQAASLGCRVTVQTAGTQSIVDAVRSAVGAHVIVRSVESDVDTRYAFDADAQDGPTRLVSRATAITSIDLSGEDSVHIAPIAGEVPAALIRTVRDRVGFVGVTPQGLLRAFSAGTLRHDAVRRVPYLPLADAVVVNEAEYNLLLQSQPEVVADSPANPFVTHGARGASLFRAGKELARCTPPKVAPAPGSQAIGAGDVFASTVFVGLARGGRPAQVLEDAVHAASAFVLRPEALLPLSGPVAGADNG